MTHQNHQTNGASLEDCHTNFFALTELYGIKWRKLVWGECVGDGEEGGAPLSDPVISSYARCLAGDILCVWRRVPQPQQQDIYDLNPPSAPPPPLSLRAAKELWIFWYGEEPDLNGLVAPELIRSQGDQGSWESGLSYECRSLLFKALHNLIERCLLSRDFVRLGKWFVQPYDGDEEDVGNSPWHLSFSFAFFLHGESTVCASVDVRQHPPVRTLSAKRRARRDQPPKNKVILAPFGLEGTVTGREWSDSDAATARLLDAWRQLYPLEQGCGAVEVVCSGVRMRYPRPYALVTEMEAGGARPAAAPALVPAAAHALHTPSPHQPAEVCYADATTDKEDFVDPTRKTPCTCAKWRRRRGRPPPFHRRRPETRRRAPPPSLETRRGAACSPGSCGAASPAPASPHHAPPQHLQSGATSAATSLAAALLHTPAPTPDPLAPPTPAPAPAPPKHYPGDSPSAPQPSPPCLAARPTLPAAERRLDPLEDEHSLHLLYDYTTVHAWLEHPVKRFKTEDNCFREDMALGAAATDDLYAGHDHTKMAAMPDHTLLHVKQEKQEPIDEKDYKNLFTSDGLCPTLKDLDQIFDNSDDAASGDETVRLLQVQTPPDSFKTEPLSRCVRPEELSKMFPTPPSLEAHAQPSPGFCLPDDGPHAHTHAHTHVPHATHAHKHPAGSPQPDPIEDWSYVFKPPTVYKYVGSSKYAPLATLPSQLLPPVTLPAAAVYRPRWQQDKRDDERRTGVKRSGSPLSEARSRGARSAGTPAPASNAPAPHDSSAAPSPAMNNSTSGRLSALSLPAESPRALLAACPLLLNVLLADTVLNVFRDHNFDSCTLCVCNAGPKMVGNILGSDAATYLSGLGVEPPAGEDEPSRCTCGFSAVVNRRRGHRAGLFYEDELEITGVAPAAAGAGADLGAVAGVVVPLCAAPPAGPASALARAAAARARSDTHDHLALNLLEYSDGGAAALRALRAAAGGATPGASAVHRWPFIGARAPRSSRDVVRLMRRLRPLLQDAIQKRCCGMRMWDGVSGPLTWRQFHRLAGRGNEDLCEPQPVPPLVVGHDRDWISLSPYALRHWERLSLEPYSYTRDVAYLVLAADGEGLTDPLKTFFRELSTAYESCRLGRHQPITRLARDGIVRTAPGDSRDSSSDEWTGDLPPGRLGEYLRAYADTLRSSIVPQLASLQVDRTLVEERGAQPSPMRPPSTPDPATPSSQTEEEPPAGADEGGKAALVLYLVEPPAAAAHRERALHALLRLAAALATHLHHHNPLVKIISLEGVCETWSGAVSPPRALAFSVFSGARRLLQHAPNGKSLTGFGTAAAANLVISNKDEKNRAAYRLFSPAWILGEGGAPRAKDVAESWGAGGGCGAEPSAVLFLSYCLSHDQRWLLAAATDARGELLDTAAINIHVPARSRRRRSAPARRLGLTKLMDFTLGVMSQAAQPWRLVVGRVGRIGHGELKGWSWLLSRKNLMRASNALREICSSCSVMYPSGVPCILSACLVSTEPDSCLRLMADRFTPDERFSQASIQSHLHTPRDVTATHILVFPTSATTQSNQIPFEPPLANGEDNDMNVFGVDMSVDEEMGEENMDLLMGGMDIVFNNMWQGSPRASPRRHDDEASQPGSPARHQHVANNSNGGDTSSEQVGTVLQQPLALGYLVSTAPVGGMPSWWWAGCAHLADACPAFLKTALHLHAGSVHAADDFTSFTQRDHNTHPLDSQLTTDVLRYVLEGYNALSWLSLDGTTHDRLSCLPFHVQVLMQLYHTAAALG